MILKSIEGVDFSDKKVLIRVDFNMDLDHVAEIQEHFRLEITKKTIDHVAPYPGAKVALLTHFGRPSGKPDPRLSVSRLQPVIERSLERKVSLVSDCIGEAVVRSLNELHSGECLLLENVRFHAEEETNDDAFAQELAAPFDIFINEAFSVSHRAHASVVKITEHLPSYAGFRLAEEIKQLDRMRLAPEHPAVAVVGGAKIETKLPLIRNLESNYDCILVGGKIANEAIDQGMQFSEKVILPKDFDSSERLDIGPTTIAFFTKVISMAKTVVWNGPLGKFEEKPHDLGTNTILHAMLESDAFVVIGGGESLAVIEKERAMSKVGYVSSGGGAMLEYMSGKELPGLKALEA